MWVLIDQNLKSYGSHNATTAMAVLGADSLSKVIGNIDCSIGHPGIIKKIGLSFSSPEVRFPDLRIGPIRIWAIFLAILRNSRHLVQVLAEEAGATAGQMWLWRDADPRNAYAAFYLACRYRKEIKIALYFHNHPSRYLMLPFGWLLRLSRVANLVCVHEDPLLARRFSDITGLPCGVLPFPMPVRRAVTFHAKTDRNLVVSVLGSPRIEKGIDIVADLIPLIANELKDGRITLRIQAQRTGDKSVDPVIDRLFEAARNYDRLQLLGLLDGFEYERILAQTDLLLLPYRRSSYGLRNSGIVMEGVAGGKILLITEGTLMADFAGREGVHIAIQDGDALSIATALREALRCLQPMTVEARRRAERFAHKADPVSLLADLENLFASPKSFGKQTAVMNLM
jgi:glycosyltransferase involved in cell wall biosynthesis